jgi:hypothetical protein
MAALVVVVLVLEFPSRATIVDAAEVLDTSMRSV